VQCAEVNRQSAQRFGGGIVGNAKSIGKVHKFARKFLCNITIDKFGLFRSRAGRCQLTFCTKFILYFYIKSQTPTATFNAGARD
jgi:hypothetical protein